MTGPILRRNSAVTARELVDGEGTLLLHTSTGAYHRLNRTGALIWRALELPIGLEELERRLRSDVGEAPFLLSEDLAAYVADLAGRDLIHLERPGNPADTGA